MRFVISCVSLAIVASGCGRFGAMSSSNSAGGGASASVHDAAGRELGILTVSESDGGLLTSGVLRGLAPGTHGIHIHATGQCTAPFATAGGHWNPAVHQHGFDNPQGPHAGDMQNIVVGVDSAAAINVKTRSGTLRGPNGLLDADGAAIVVHAGPDDYKTDPAGNSGARVACGVIVGK
ncbi:MAG: superoxide dismutase family protein [bacterium]